MFGYGTAFKRPYDVNSVTVICYSCGIVSVRHSSAEPLAAPTPDNAPKIYPLKIEKLVDDIAGLTLVEVSELSELLKKRLNLPDAPVMPVGGFVAAGAAVNAPEEVCTVVLL